MKKIIIMMLVAMLTLTACSGKPGSMDENTYNLGCKALEVMEAYNNLEIDRDEANDTLEAIYERLKDIEFEEDQASESTLNGLVAAEVLTYQIHMISGEGLFETTKKLKKILNK